VTNPEHEEPDLDRLSRDQVRELDPLYGPVIDVLDDWLFAQHGVTSSHHCVGAFLDALAAAGYRVTPIEPGPTFADR
jgi:glycine/D-amino acid oxidase-like deaminating enzyme